MVGIIFLPSSIPLRIGKVFYRGKWSNSFIKVIYVYYLVGIGVRINLVQVSGY